MSDRPPLLRSNGGWYLAGLALAAALAWGLGALFEHPHRPPPGSVKIEGEGDAASVLSSWSERRGDHPAPPLRLRAAATDLGSWWWKESTPEPTPQAQDDGNGVSSLTLEVSLPSAAGFTAAQLGPLCDGQNPQPYAGCAISKADLKIEREDTAWDQRDILLGEKEPPSQQRERYDQRSTQILARAWLRRGHGGGPGQLLGWDCDSGPGEVDPPTALRIERAEPRLACYQPGVLRRIHPGWFGLERQTVYFECREQEACKVWFLYRGRIASVDVYGRHGAEIRPLAAMMFVGAWQMLERARADADAAVLPTPARRLDEAREQSAACAAIAQDVARLKLDTLRSDKYDPYGWASLPCIRAGRLALLIGADQPGQALPLFAAALAGLGAFPFHSSEREHFLRGQIDALQRSGQAQSPELMQALLDLGEQLPSNTAERKTSLQQAWDIAGKLGAQVPPATLLRLAQALAFSYEQANQLAGDYAAVAGTYGQLAQLLAQAQAPAGTQLHALDLQGFALWRANDFAGIKLCADRMLPLYLSRADGDWGGATRDEIGFDGVHIVFFYTVYAFHEQAFAEMEGSIAQAVARTVADQGADSRFARAAQFHQQQVQSRQMSGNTPIGGGYLGF